MNQVNSTLPAGDGQANGSVRQIVLPRRSRGRQSSTAQAIYWRAADRFARQILQINSTLDFQVSSRGWCYLLEGWGLTKDEFDACQDAINDCRKDGSLPLDIVADDAKRAFHNVEQVDDVGPEEFARAQLAATYTLADQYLPVSFWEDQDHYVQEVVEKIDLRELFKPVCGPFRIPIANAGGWSNLGVRAEMMTRFKYWEARGKKPVLLYCGDFDPAGVRISDFLMDNLIELERAVGWDPRGLIIDRFGLNLDFIEANGLSWINNLITGGKGKMSLADPRHKDHAQPYVQNWLRDIGERKVEANALVVRPEAGRRLCLDAITKYVDPEAPQRYEELIRDDQDQVRAAFEVLVPSAPWDE